MEGKKICLKLHKENALQDKSLCKPIEILRLRNDRDREYSACSVEDIITIIHRKISLFHSKRL